MRSQVYLGIGGEDPRGNRAVAATQRQVITYKGDLITAYYSSTSGGFTENSENAFGGDPVPYLVGVADPYDAISPLHRWSKPPTFTASQLGQRLRLGSSVQEFTVTRRGVSPRAMTVRVELASGQTINLTGLQVKARLGLPDTWFWIRRSDRPDPGEPPIAGATTPPATPTRPSRPVSQVIARGRWMAVAARGTNRRAMSRIAVRVKRKRPGVRMFRRSMGSRSLYVISTGRYANRKAALRERAVLRRMGFTAHVVAARHGDPIVRPPARSVVGRSAPARVR